MEKPVYLREPTWKFLIHQLAAIPPKDQGALLLELKYEVNTNKLAAISARPGPFLLWSGLLGQPDLLANTVIEFESGVEYLISQTAAQQISNGLTDIVLERIYDHQPKTVTIDEIKDAILNGSVFDQLDR